ncbi:MAG TPA: RsmB/NOP family class I SAM-dependent RNA methyltransferase [Caulobacteraceae bacterium]|jgi:16S rRNA (cytosine967-C5)-methyltransferase|nr:RsmB/NOP family class I SAM-dependent RNA methyltransferase [Caulobacteraceae bacterium]
MRDGGRLSAAIAVVGDIAARHRPARLALKAWGDAARYAGAKDRAFVSGLVLDVLRRRRSLAWRMDDEGDRAAVLGAVRFAWDWPLDRVAAAAGEEHGPGALSAEDSARLAEPMDLNLAPAAVRGDWPDWLSPHMGRAFGEGAAAEGAALARRAPVDVRVNTLKTDVVRALKALAPFGAQPAGILDTAIRIAAPAASDRAAPIEAAPEFAKGWFEVQDLGSQIAAACAGDIAHRQVLDLCAGGGGKTLALAAAMANTGQLFAHDADARRLAETARRAQRAGIRNLQIRSPIHPTSLAGLEERMDLVFVDAPCTGSGVWRRHPDAKWRVSPAQLTRRMAEQDQVLAAAAPFVKRGGRLVYVTCSLFAEENEDRIAAFLERSDGFVGEPAAGVADVHLTADGFLRLTPLAAGTDGFFVAVLRREV